MPPPKISSPPPSVEENKLSAQAISFIKSVEALCEKILTTEYIYDTNEAIHLVYDSKDIFQHAILYAYDSVNKVPLRSLSYIFHDNTIIHLRDRHDIRCIQNALEQVPGSYDERDASFRIQLSHSECVFSLRGGSAYSEIGHALKKLAITYNNMVFSSHNFKNHISASVYNQGKPESGDQKLQKYEVSGDDKTAYYPKFDTFEDICEYVGNKFGAKAKYFVYFGNRRPSEEKIFELFKAYESDTPLEFLEIISDITSIRRDIIDAIVVKQSRIGVIQTPDRIRHYAIFPVFDPIIGGSTPQGIVIVIMEARIGLLLMRSAEGWLSSFLSKRHILKTRVISEFWERAQRDISALGPYPLLDQRLKCYTRLSNDLLKEICRCTDAGSASLRQVDRNHGILRRIAFARSKWGNYSENREAESDYNIDLLNYSTSLLAFAVIYPGEEKVLHVRDINEIPGDYSAHGLRSIESWHEFTMSCAVARVVAGRSLVALLNIEAPVIASLGPHLNFFDDCADILGETYRRLLSISDSAGLAIMAKMHINMHDIIGRVRNWNEGDDKAASDLLHEIKGYLPSDDELQERQLAFPGEKEFRGSVKNFNITLRNWVRALLEARGSEHQVEDLLCGKVPSTYDTHLLPSLFVIITSIFGNIEKHPPIENNKISFRDEKIGYPTVKSLTITWESSAPITETVDRQSILFKPLDDSHSSRKHFGFFLIGAYARQQGGSAEFVDTKNSEGTNVGFKVVISLPYRPSGVANDAPRQRRGI